MTILRLSRILVLVALALILGSAANAQNPGYQNNVGMQPYGSYIATDIDTVDLAHGGLKIHIPVVSRKARGFDSSVSLNYDSKYWSAIPYTFDYMGTTMERYIWETNTGGGGPSMAVTPGGNGISNNQQVYTCTQYDDQAPPPQLIVYSNWQYLASDGTAYNFPVRKVQQYPPVGNPNIICTDAIASTPQLLTAPSENGGMKIDISAYDGSGSNTPRTVKAWFKDGTLFNPQAGLVNLTDTNGNQCCDSQNGWVLDSLGRPFFGSSGPGGTSFYDSNGQVRTVQIQTTTLQLSAPFLTSGPASPDSCGFDVNNGHLTVWQSITLPNGLTYTFSYDDPDHPGQSNPYGEITKITLPTGGYIKYKWTTLPEVDVAPGDAICGPPSLDSRVVIERDVSDGVNVSVWTYSYSGGITTVTDPLGNIQAHTFTDLGDAFEGAPLIVETQVEYRNPSNTPLRRVTTDWATDTGPTAAASLLNPPDGTGDPTGYLFGMTRARNPRVIRVTTTLLDTNQVAKTETDYLDCYSWSAYGQNLTDCPANPTQVRQYDYAVGAPGLLVRYSTLAYKHASDSNYFNAHIWDLVTLKSVYDGSGVLWASTQYGYDTTTLGPPITGVPYHDDADYPVTNLLRGNQTSVGRFLCASAGCASGIWLTSTNYFNQVGNLIQATDPNTNSTYFSYADNFTDSSKNGNTQGFITSVTYPTTSNGVPHVEGTQYFWYTGSVAASCGQNYSNPAACSNSQNPTQSSPVPDYAKYSYDMLGRPLTVTKGDGGTASFTFSDLTSNATPLTVGTSSKVDTYNTLVNTVVLDGLGRTTTTQLNSDPCGADLTDTTYDALGRKSTLTNPYRLTDFCNVSTSTNGTTAYQYDALGRVKLVIAPDGSQVSTSYSGNSVTVADPAGRQRRSVTDALGRIIQVFEDPSGLNYETDYTYDVLDNLTNVVQSGSRQRSFAYDSLSRLTGATNPESGTILYAYDSDGNLLTKYDARGVTATMTYDQLNRILTKTYNDSPQTPSASFVYDVSNLWGGTQTNTIGKLMEESTGTGTIATVFNYDSMGRVTLANHCLPAVCKGLGYGYNFLGDVAHFSNDNGLDLYQTFDPAGRVTQVTSAGMATVPTTLATTSSFTPAGAISQMTYGNGLVEASVYNNRLQPTQLRTYLPGTGGGCGEVCGGGGNDGPPPSPDTDILNLSYGYATSAGTNNGNVTSLTSTATQVFMRTYTYDSLNRLSTMSSPDDASGCYGLSWTYDAWGNRPTQSATGGSGSACPQPNHGVLPNNRLTDSGFSYDTAGNMTGDGHHTYMYDAENHLMQVDGALGNCSTATACYIYDARGARVEKITSAGKIDYLRDLWGNVAVEWETGLNGYTGWGNGYIYANGQLLAEYEGATTYFVHKDHLGSTRVMTNISGGVTNSMDYFPYGEISSSAVLVPVVDEGFESGLIGWVAGFWGCNSTTSTTQYHSGASSLAQTGSVTGGSYQDVTGLTSGATYQVSVWVKADAGTRPKPCSGRMTPRAEMP